MSGSGYEVGVSGCEGQGQDRHMLDSPRRTRRALRRMCACTVIYEERFTTGDRKVHGHQRSGDVYEVGAQDARARAKTGICQTHPARPAETNTTCKRAQGSIKSDIQHEIDRYTGV